MTNSSDDGLLPNGCPIPNEMYAYPMRLFGIFEVIFVSIYMVFVLGLWIWRRDNYMLKKRNFDLVVVSGIGVYFSVFSTGYVDWIGTANFPCHAHAALVFMIVPLAAGPVVVRLILFYNKYQYSNLLLKENRRSNTIKPGRFKQSKSLLARFKTLLQFSLNIRSVHAVSEDESDTQSLRSDDIMDHESIAETDSGTLRSRSNNAIYVLRFMSSAYAYSFLSLSLFLVIGIVSIIIQYTPDDSPYMKGCYGCILDKFDFIYMGATILLIIVFGGYFLQKVRGVEDPLGIKFELQMTLVSGTVVLLGVVLIILDPGNVSENRLFDHGYIINFGAILFFSAQSLWPVIRTFETDEVAKDISLEEVLRDNRLRLKLAKYLATEFSLENMWFYDAVYQYRKLYDKLSAEKIEELAQEIYSSFLAEGGVMEVNIGSGIRKRVAEKLESIKDNADAPPFDLFDEAQECVFKLIEEDSFPRFLRSKYFNSSTSGSKTTTITPQKA